MTISRLNSALARFTTPHYIALALTLLVGLALRLWHLDSKPLWLDEVLTAIFASGHSYRNLSLNVFFPLTALDQVFQFQPGLSCPMIAQRVLTASVHPPLFFCLLYGWLNWLRPSAHWVWALRLLPALFGVATILAIYWLNRVAFSARSGLLAAALMAVSPFAVYLSQEARHYTLPMLIVTLALVMLVQMQQDLILQKQRRPLIWLSWSLLNILGLYTHYFCLLSLMAQIIALTGWMLWRRGSLRQIDWLVGGAAIALIALSYLPWLPTLIQHFSRPETDWLIPYKPDWLARLAPLYQIVVGWTLMVIALPVEQQPLWVAIPASLIMLSFLLWLVWQLKTGLRHLWRSPGRQPATLIAGFIICILLQFFAIIYLLDKDISVVPRYHFIYYPAVCALIAAALSSKTNEQHLPSASGFPTGTLPVNSPLLSSIKRLRQRRSQRQPSALILAGLLSSVLVVNGFVFQKSYHPEQVAKWMAFELNRPLLVVMNYQSPQEIALGLSFALELRRLYPVEQVDQVGFAFVDHSQGYGEAWDRLSKLAQPLRPPLNLWIVASPGMHTEDYPAQLKLKAPATDIARPRMRCDVDPEGFHRLGFPYQLFRCQPIVRR